MGLGARTLLVAPGIATSNKKLLGTKGIATRSKDATSSEIGTLAQDVGCDFAQCSCPAASCCSACLDFGRKVHCEATSVAISKGSAWVFAQVSPFGDGVLCIEKEETGHEEKKTNRFEVKNDHILC